METKGGLLLVFVVLALSAATTNATIVTIGITGEITYVGRGEWPNENFKVGDIITGSYTYDTDTPDQNPSPTIGHYQYSTVPYGIILQTDNFVFKPDPDHVDFLITILNDNSGRDCYCLLNYGTILLPDNIHIGTIGWQLDDYSGTALDTDALPTTLPSLENWQGELMIESSYKGGAILGARVSTVYLIPEPATLLFLTLGGAILMKHKWYVNR